ncbi:Chloroperoxidase [Mycena capillaripes]|nr:Chloroperoxidase [Mycena capillaripes]
MRRYTAFSLLTLAILPVSALSGPAISPTSTLEIQDGQTGTLIVLPPQATETGLKKIPDGDHPFIAPGPDDQRGPCPAMNTLANHGYISRNGITTFEEITLGMMEAFNIERNLGAFMVASNMMTGGNSFVNKISIGGVSPLVPPLPGGIEGPVTSGIAIHGRVEGDASITRADTFIGDSRNFQEDLFDLDLLQLEKFGDNGPNGNNTVFNLPTLVAIKQQNFMMDQVANPEFTFPARRLGGALTDVAFILTVFANGTTTQATLPNISLFFRNQTFPDNWFRAASPVTALVNGEISGAVGAAFAVPPGRNNAQGVYVADPPPPAPFNISFACTSYYDLLGTMPAGLANTTGILKQNVELLSSIIFSTVEGIDPACNQLLLPFGPAATA